MALSPIAFIAPNYRDFKNYWLKVYVPGTTTPKIMSLDSGGVVNVAKLELNKDGFIESSGGALVIPYIDGFYDAWLFPTEAEADADNTTNAEKVADNITGANGDIIANSIVVKFDVVDDAVTSTDGTLIFDGSSLNIEELTAGNGGGGMWDVVLVSTITPNGDNKRACTGLATFGIVRRDSQIICKNKNDYATFGSNIAGTISLTNHTPGTSGMASTSVTIESNKYYRVFVDITTTAEGFVKILFDGTDAIYGDQTNGLFFSDAAILGDASENNRLVTVNEYYFSLITSGTSFTTLSIETDLDWGGTITTIEVEEITPREFGLAITASDGEAKDNQMGVKGGAFNRGDISVGDKPSLGAMAFDGLSPTPAFNAAFGSRTLSINFKGDQNTAVGSFALQSNEGSNSVGVGYSALKLATKGQENTSIGYKSGTFITTGFRNVFAGFWAGQGINTGSNNVDIGFKPILAAGNRSGSTHVGANSGIGVLSGNSNTFIGSGSATLVPSTSTPTIALTAATALGQSTQPYGDFCVCIGSGARVGSDSGGVVTFAPDAVAIGSNAVADKQDSVAIGKAASSTTVAGVAIGDTATVTTDQGVAIGDQASATGSRAICIGSSSTSGGTQSTVIGSLSTPSGNSIASLGFRAINNFSGVSNSALGHTAGLQATETFVNCTLLGSLSVVTGSNQVQLGDSATTTYAFGAVQDRSDRRDKIDFQEITDSHISFFMDIEWRRYRMDYRENYTDLLDDGTIKKSTQDGSRAGSRYHIGAVAQQVEEAMLKHNVDFAGLQHHSVNDGHDVYSIGYQEFIGLQGLIIQKQQARLKSIEDRLDAAGI